MEEKNELKISLKLVIAIICVATVIAIISIYLLFSKNVTQPEPTQSQVSNLTSSTLSIRNYENQEYYIIEKDYEGNYDLQFLSLSDYYGNEDEIRSIFETKKVMDYTQYKAYCDKWKLKQLYMDTSKNYIVFSYLAYFSPNLHARLADVKYTNQNVDLYIWNDAQGITADISAYVLIIPTDRVINSINIIPVYTEEEYKNIQNYNVPYNPSIDIDY